MNGVVANNIKHNNNHSSFPPDHDDKAALAFAGRDIEAAATSPDNNNIFHGAYSELTADHDETHKQTSSDYLKAIVFGGLDGIVTIFAVVAGCVGADLDPVKIIIVGLGNLFADAVSMGFGEYVSASAERDFIESERRREQFEVETRPEDEKTEMRDIYTGRYGFSEEDASLMVDVSFKYPKFFLQHMMVEELGLMSDGDEATTPIQRGLVMFVSFSVFGLVPLAGFVAWVVMMGRDVSNGAAMGVASVMSLITLFILGDFKGRHVDQNVTKSGLLMAVNGVAAGLIAYGIGSFLQRFVGPVFAA